MCVTSLTPPPKPLVVFRAKLWLKWRVDPSGLPSTLQSHSQCYRCTSVTMCAGGFRCVCVRTVPGNDEGSACAGMNTYSCTDFTWGLNGRRRSLGPTVNVCINAHRAARPVFSSHIHQHDNISKMQPSIVCHSKIHLHT